MDNDNLEQGAGNGEDNIIILIFTFIVLFMIYIKY